MNSYETSATVEEQGQITVAGVPFAPGTEVEVTICAKRRSSEEFIVAWRRIRGELRGQAAIQNITDDEILDEIGGYRATS